MSPKTTDGIDSWLLKLLKLATEKVACAKETKGKNEYKTSMKNFFKLFVALVLVASSFSCASQMSKKAKLKTGYDTVSYMIGMSIGAFLQ